MGGSSFLLTPSWSRQAWATDVTAVRVDGRLVVDSGLFNLDLLRKDDYGDEAAKRYAASDATSRLDSIIAHEYEEHRHGGSHVEALKHAPKTTLTILLRNCSRPSPYSGSVASWLLSAICASPKVTTGARGNNIGKLWPLSKSHCQFATVCWPRILKMPAPA